MDVRLYVMTHKKIAELPDPMYVPMQVGKAGKEDFGYLGDDTGDNISEKNSMYCELTGLYWLWKNMDCDVIGICYYRRYFVRNEKLLYKAYIENLMKEYAIVIPNSACVKDADVYHHYQNRHYTKDLDLCREVIAEKYPEYIPAYDFCIHTILVSPGNMWITKKEIFDKYCSWLFDILFEVEKRIDVTGYDTYQKRVMGFLSERLFRVWLMMQKEKVTEEYVKMIAPEDLQNGNKRRDLLYRYVKLKIQPVIKLHSMNNMTETLAEPMDCGDDFEGKIPVWLCWWQGEAEMPEVVRLCVESIKRNIPKEKAVVRLITFENCMKYVTLTDTVIRKFKEGKISLAHFSDLLCVELLYRYGGMWINATCYVSAPLSEKVYERELYTLRCSKKLGGQDIVEGRWSKNFWIATKGQKLFQLMMESLWYYWEQEETEIDDSLIDYILAVEVNEFPDIREKLEQCQYYEDDIFELSKWMNKKFKLEYRERMEEKTRIYKLSCKENYFKTNIAGEQTVYGYLATLLRTK